MRIFAVPVLALAAACQTAQPVPKPQTWEEYTRDHPDRFVEGYRASIDRVAADLKSKRKGQALDGVRPFVDAYLPAGDYTLVSTGANAAILRELRVDSTTNSLVQQGYDATQFADAGQAKSLVAAAAKVIGGGDTPADIFIFSPVVVLADLVRVDARSDGSADLVYRVVEPIKRSPAKGAEFRMQLRGASPQLQSSAPGVPPPPPPPDPAGQERSQTPHQLLTLRLPMEPSPYPFQLVTQPMGVEGETVYPGYHSMWQGSTIPAIKEAVKGQICKPGFVPVSGTPAFSIPC